MKETFAITLFHNYPNPFSTETIISWIQQNDEHVSVVIYDILGRLVRKLVDKPMLSGSNFSIWDGKDKEGKTVASGIYFLCVETQNERKIIKTIYLR
jgi:flagellar hook assembly protein FlgD